MNFLVILAFVLLNAPLGFVGLRLSCGPAKPCAGRREMAELVRWPGEIPGNGSDDGGLQ